MRKGKETVNDREKKCLLRSRWDRKRNNMQKGKCVVWWSMMAYGLHGA